MSPRPRSRGTVDINKVAQPVSIDNRDHFKANLAAQIDLLRILVRHTVLQVSALEVAISPATGSPIGGNRKPRKSKAERPLSN